MSDFFRYIAIQAFFVLVAYVGFWGLFGQSGALLVVGVLVTFLVTVHLVAFFFRMCGKAIDWYYDRKESMISR